jgi:lactate racemase
VSRPGFVLTVDERTPPLLMHSGESFKLQEFPLGTRVIYPAESLPAVPDLDEAIENALLHPIDSDPLPALLTAGMKLTIAFDDLSLPLPQMRKPDVRQRILEHVLQHAADAGVDDVELIVATALHRRMTADEVKSIVGERVFRSFWPDQLYNFDAEDRANLAHLGKTDRDEDVEISKRAAESDLLVYVNVNLVAMDGGWKSTAIGLASYNSLRHHHNAHTMINSKSFMDPHKSELHSSAWRMGRVLSEHVKVFQIETTLNNDAFPSQYGFLTKREWEWSLRDQAMFLGTKRGLDLMPAKTRRRTFQQIEAPYAITGVNAGAVEPVHEKTLERVHQQQLVEVNGQTDVLVMGLPYLCPYNVNSVMNPILAA